MLLLLMMCGNGGDSGGDGSGGDGVGDGVGDGHVDSERHLSQHSTLVCHVSCPAPRPQNLDHFLRRKSENAFVKK